VCATTIGGEADTLAQYTNAAAQELSWSPDGSRITFASDDPDDDVTGDIWELPASGGDARRLARHALSPAYRPRP
jgi:hypothetical protein